MVEQVRAIARTRNATPGQVALAWLLARKPWIVPIPGTTKLQRLHENLGATDVALSGEDLHHLTELSSTITIQGGRYPEFLEAQTNL